MATTQDNTLLAIGGLTLLGAGAGIWWWSRRKKNGASKAEEVARNTWREQIALVGEPDAGQTVELAAITGVKLLSGRPFGMTETLWNTMLSTWGKETWWYVRLGLIFNPPQADTTLEMAVHADAFFPAAIVLSTNPDQWQIFGFTGLVPGGAIERLTAWEI